MDFKRWMVHRTQLYLYIEEAESGGVRLLRCYGDSPAIAVPGEINGYPVTEIGNYCFADSARVREAPERPDGTRSLSGEYLQQVELPDTVKLKETEAEAYSAILDIVIKLQKELPMSYVFYGQDSLVEDNTRYDEIGVFLPNSHFLKNLERHVSKAEAIIYADN